MTTRTEPDMTHLKAIAHHLTEKGYFATYTGTDPTLTGLLRIAITNPELTKTLHINCWEHTPHKLFLATGKHATNIDLNDPTSLDQLEQLLQTKLTDEALQ